MYWETGDVCISILHPPGEDQWGYEQASERWLPVHTVESILVSVISMLSSPNDESPANLDAAVCRQQASHEHIVVLTPSLACLLALLCSANGEKTRPHTRSS